MKTIELRNSTSITFHWVKGPVGLKGNERPGYLAKIPASYNTTIAYDAIPINRGKQILEDYYIKIWKAIKINPANASHTILFIPTTFHRLSLHLWPKFILTQFLTNHGSFRSYLHKTNKTPSPICAVRKRLYKRPATLWQYAAYSQMNDQQYFKFFPHLWSWSITQMPSASHTSSEISFTRFKNNLNAIKLCNNSDMTYWLNHWLDLFKAIWYIGSICTNFCKYPVVYLSVKHGLKPTLHK